MKLKRMYAVFSARNTEFFRDRAAFGWNLMFPFLIIVGFGIIFGGDMTTVYKIGVFPVQSSFIENPETLELPEGIKHLRYMDFVGFPDRETALDRLTHHKIDLLIRLETDPPRYWINESSPKGYIVEKMFLAAMAVTPPPMEKQKVPGRQIRYIDWLFPGVLSMNMMFSALWGVGYIVVRYRKNGALKRLKVTPLTPFEYLSAQVLSRIFVLMLSLLILWIGSDLLFHFQVEGSYVNLFIAFFLGCTCLSALGLVVASRGVSEEFVSGVINFITWPMMFLSEVWFSLEGSPDWLITISKCLPLTRMNHAVRAVMLDGVGFAVIFPDLLALSATTFLFLIIAASLFSWNR